MLLVCKAFVMLFDWPSGSSMLSGSVPAESFVRIGVSTPTVRKLKLVPVSCSLFGVEILAVGALATILRLLKVGIHQLVLVCGTMRLVVPFDYFVEVLCVSHKIHPRRLVN